MKAIIPVAGAGTKLRPHTYTQPKALIPIAGKTILSFIVDQLHEAGINEFIFIVGYLGEVPSEPVHSEGPEHHPIVGHGDAVGEVSYGRSEADRNIRIARRGCRRGNGGDVLSVALARGFRCLLGDSRDAGNGNGRDHRDHRNHHE